MVRTETSREKAFININKFKVKMKTKFILGSLALAATFVGCSNEEVGNVAANENQSGMIELSKDFMIGAVGAKGVESRTHWDLVENNTKLRNFFAPYFVGSSSLVPNNTFGGSDVNAPAIGLCWLGQAPGENVYTNYEFIHNGWLADGMAEPVFDECDPSELLTGYTYDELNTSATDGEEIFGLDTYTPAGNVDDADLTKTYEGEALDDINWNSGVFKTENKSIFGGDYIAYFPFDASFINAGTIPAKSKTVFDVYADNLTDSAVAENTFRYTNVATIDGGAKASGFVFNNLSGIVRVSLQNEAPGSTFNVEKIVLYSESKGFLKEVRLSASAIAAEKEGTELYSEVVEKSNNVILNAPTGIGVATAGDDTSIALNAVYFSALPATISDLKVLLFDEGTGTWAEYEVGNLTIPAGGSTGITLTVAETDFQSVYYAIDEASLTQAVAATAGATEDNPATIKLLGDITLTTDLTINNKYVTVEGAKIIVPEAVVLFVQKATIKSDIDVLGESCCSGSANRGELLVGSATIDGEVYIYAGEGEGKLAARMQSSNTQFTSNSKVTVEGLAYTTGGQNDVKGEMVVAENGTLTVNASSVLTIKGATLENNGTIEVLADGKFEVVTATGSSTAAAGANFTNNGDFIDNINANVGGATQYMVNNGNYICKVASQDRLNIAYTNKTACNIIEFVNTTVVTYNLAVAVKHNDEQVDLIVNSTAGTTFGTLSGVAATVGNVEVNDALTIATTSATSAGAYTGTITVAGDINVNSSIEFAENVRNFKANNLYVNENATATFGNRNNYTGVTMAVSGTIEVKEDATFTITDAAAGKNIADVTCTELVEGGTFHGMPRIVAAE